MENSIYDMKFRRKFSVNPYKTLQMKLGEMSFFKDWLRTDRGEPYPLTLPESAGVRETVGGTCLQTQGMLLLKRHGGSWYNWSCGNIYVYESDLMDKI